MDTCSVERSKEHCYAFDFEEFGLNRMPMVCLWVRGEENWWERGREGEVKEGRRKEELIFYIN